MSEINCILLCKYIRISKINLSIILKKINNNTQKAQMKNKNAYQNNLKTNE